MERLDTSRRHWEQQEATGSNGKSQQYAPCTTNLDGHHHVRAAQVLGVYRGYVHHVALPHTLVASIHDGPRRGEAHQPAKG